MLLITLLITVISLVIAIGIRLIDFIDKNRKAHQYFEKHLPNLPVLPKPNIFNGHCNQVFFPPKNWKNLDNCHKQYGATFGFYYCDKPAISTTDLDIIKKVVIDEKQVNRINLDIPVKEFKDDNIAFANDDQWARLRKAIAPAFTHHKIVAPNVQDVIDDVIDRFIGSMEEKLIQSGTKSQGKGIMFDADDIFHRYSLDLVFSCFYKQYDTIDYNKEEEFYVKLIDQSAKTCSNPLSIFSVMFPVFIPMLEWLTVNIYPQGHLIRKLRKFIKQQTLLNLRAKQQLAKAKLTDLEVESSRENFMMEDGTRFKRNLVDYVIDQFHAANKTLADALSKLVYHLATDQDVQDKLRDAVLVDGIESEYLQWCIDESLRLFPPVMGASSRILKQDIETKVGLLPAGSFMITPGFSICRNKEYWGPDADEFKPDRWAHSGEFNPVQYIAFGLGKRNCLGREFALNGTKKLMVELLHRYRFIPTPETNAEKIMEFGAPGLIFLTPDYPTYIKLCRVES